MKIKFIFLFLNLFNIYGTFYFIYHETLFTYLKNNTIASIIL